MRRIPASVASLAALGVAAVVTAAGGGGVAVSASGGGAGGPIGAARPRGPATTTQVALARAEEPAPGAAPGAEKIASPLALTASDGSGLRLVSLTASAAVDAPLALTELHLVFENPEPRVREGTFTARLPPGASVARFAMKIDGRFQEGEVVEKQAARRAYEDFLHRRQDPALLEEGMGNLFSARVFPIPAKGRKEIVIAYASRVGSGDPYRLALRGLPSLERLEAHVARRGRADVTYRVDEARFRPGEDLVLPDEPLAPAAAGALAATGVRGGRAVALRAVVPRLPSPDQPFGAGERLVVLVDTSASRALDLRDVAAATRALLARIPAEVPVTVTAFDQDVAPLYAGAAGGFGDAHVVALLAREALGASDLGYALDHTRAALAPATAGPGVVAAPARVLVVTDGVATLGARAPAELREKVRALGAVGVSRLDVLAVGGLRDEPTLGALVRGGLARDGLVLDGARGAADVAARLARGTSSGVPVRVEGARFVWPATLDGVQAGDEVTVVADVPEGHPVRLDVGDASAAPDVRAAPADFVGRALGEAEIASLVAAMDGEKDAAARQALAARAVELGKAHRVVSRFTSLLVLETEADYARYGIDRSKKLEVLGVVDGHVQRVAVGRGEPAAAAAEKKDDAAPRGATATNRRFGVAGPAAGDTSADSKEGGFGTRAKLEEAAEFGMIGMLPNPSASAAPSDPLSARGAIWGDDVRDSFGAGALGLSGVGEGGGGAGNAQGAGASGGGLGGAHASGSPAPPPRPASPRPARPRTLAAAAEREAPETSAPWGRDAADVDPSPRVSPYEGRMADVMRALAAGDRPRAASVAKGMLEAGPTDLLALLATGEVAEAKGELGRAARAYGSIVDLFGFRADLRRYAAERLERLADARAREVARDALAVAAEDRPDHPSGARLHAYALVREGRHAEAFEVLAKAHARPGIEGRFRGVPRILAEDLGLVAAAWTKAEPARAAEIAKKLAAAGGTPETAPSIRFVLVWETDANDVDFHVTDGLGNHAYYAQPKLASGGELYADVTTGYGPECFTVRGPAAQRAFPYRLSAHYFRRGPMGFGMGTLHVVEHDGRGGLRVEARPYLVMRDGATVDLGVVRPRGGA